MADKLKRIVLLQVPCTVCNFRCSYCYLPIRNNFERGRQIDSYAYSPEHVGKAFSKKRLGGCCYFNICAAGETLLAKDITKYIHQILLQGHYCEIVSNMTPRKVLEEICGWDKELLSHIEFKCSFHYLELKRLNLLESFAANVNMCWEAGASINVELVPHDELIPFIEEIKAFSLAHFGALPQLTIARNDGTERIEKLTSLSEDEYKKIWGQFNSNFWDFKMKIFGEKRHEFCYAGERMIDVDLLTGSASQCYCSKFHQNVFEDLDRPIAFLPYGKHCRFPHCFNGHFLLTLGCVSDFTDITYAELRDRTTADGRHWLQKPYFDFVSQKLQAENPDRSFLKRAANPVLLLWKRANNKIWRTFHRNSHKAK